MTKERRRHVRSKPTPELPARAVLEGSLVSEVVHVIDVSVGGLALAAEGALERQSPGAVLSLRLDLGAYGEHRLAAAVRWTSPTMVGVELQAPAPAAAQALSRYVGELLERGAPRRPPRPRPPAHQGGPRPPRGAAGCRARPRRRRSMGGRGRAPPPPRRSAARQRRPARSSSGVTRRSTRRPSRLGFSARPADPG